jgi:uncharacterized protein YjbI with pentapeptide repeats
MARPAPVQAPELPQLEPCRLEPGDEHARLQLEGVLVETADGEPVRAGRVRIRESELRGVVLKAESAPGLELIDVVMRDCGLSNVDGREGLIRRVELVHSQLVGFGLNNGEVRDLRVVDSSMELASFAGTELHNVVFERVNLVEASFLEARLEAVEFIDCRMAGADFRRAKLNTCAMRGASLEGVLGVDSLSGLRMPWDDVLASAAPLAVALGITIEAE